MYYLMFAVLIILFVILTQEARQQQIIKLRKKGVRRKMPTNIIKEFLNKDCVISLFNGQVVSGKIVEVEENWMKVQEKKKMRLINGDMIADIYNKL